MDNQINKLYDIIVQKYDDYINYNKIVEKEKEQIKEKDKLLASQFFKDNEETDKGKEVITDKLKQLFVEKVIFLDIYAKDAQLLFYNLYSLVETYIQLDNAPILPKKITEACEEYAHVVPKTQMVAEKEKLQERVKGTIDGYVKATLENGAYDYYIEKMVEQMKQQNPQE